jgi:hypothetical protein
MESTIGPDNFGIAIWSILSAGTGSTGHQRQALAIECAIWRCSRFSEKPEPCPTKFGSTRLTSPAVATVGAERRPEYKS